MQGSLFMLLTILPFSEPIIMEGSDVMQILADGWTAVSADSGRSAQFEHTIVITDNGSEILSPHR